MVANLGGHILGVIGGGVVNQMRTVYVLYVHPDYKGRGIGKALLEALTTYQKHHYSITQQQVYVTSGNEPALAFYKKMGFEQIETLPNWQDSRERPDERYHRLV